jgi:hypothetical protein
VELTRWPNSGFTLPTARRAALLAVGFLAVLLLGCEAATPTPDADPRPAMRATVERLLALESVSFDLNQEAGSTMLFPGLIMHRASGVVDVPARFDVVIEAESLLPRSYIEIGIISIDGTAYMTGILNREWREVSPDTLPMTLTGLGETLAGIVEAVQEPTMVGSETLRGREVYHIRGGILSQDLLGLVPNAAEGYEVELDLWIDRTESFLLEALISGQVLATDVPESVRRLTLDDINVPVSVAAPG